MNYQYETIPVYDSAEVNQALQNYAKKGWRLHSIVQIEHYGESYHGTIKKESYSTNTELILQSNSSIMPSLLIFEKKSVIEEIKDIVNGTEDPKAS